MHHRPPVLNDIDKLRRMLESQRWRIQKMLSARLRERRLREVDEKITRLERIEQFCRNRLTEEELKGITG